MFQDLSLSSYLQICIFLYFMYFMSLYLNLALLTLTLGALVCNSPRSKEDIFTPKFPEISYLL